MRELDLLEHIYAANAALPAGVTIPPGDDMGAIDLDGRTLLVTVDQVAHGVHFDLAHTPLEKIGRKAITRNLSDVAAMAATPLGAVAAACLPRDFGDDRANRLFDAMRRTASDYACPLIGGDISVWDGGLILTVTIFATARGHAPLLRRGARIGDVICVSGELGGSLETIDGYTHHLEFQPRIKLAQALAASKKLDAHCMIDLSDGLATDLGHVCRASDVGAIIELDKLPISKAAVQRAQRTGQPTWRHALADGEDYELCFTLPGQQAGALPSELEGVKLTVIGKIVERDAHQPIMLAMPDGSCQSLDVAGWEHRG